MTSTTASPINQVFGAIRTPEALAVELLTTITELEKLSWPRSAEDRTNFAALKAAAQHLAAHLANPSAAPTEPPKPSEPGEAIVMQSKRAARTAYRDYEDENPDAAAEDHADHVALAVLRVCGHHTFKGSTARQWAETAWRRQQESNKLRAKVVSLYERVEAADKRADNE